MKNNIKRLIQIIGGIIIMAGISGCASETNHLDTKSSTVTNSVGANRTPEEAAVEAQFEPLFDFLAAEKKDFSRVESYVSIVQVRNCTTPQDVLEDNSLVFDFPEEDNSNIIGNYIEDSNDGEVKYIVTLGIDAELQFSEAAPVSYNKALFFPVIHFKDIQEGKVTDFLKSHSETELTTLSYELNSDFPVLHELLVVHNLKEEDIQTVVLNLSKSGESEFRANFIVYTSEKNISLSVGIYMKG